LEPFGDDQTPPNTFLIHFVLSNAIRTASRINNYNVICTCANVKYKSCAVLWKNIAKC